MRKVYHNEQSVAGLAMAIFFSVGLTALLFGTLPFAHRIANPGKGVELITAGTTELPPPTKEEEPPPVMKDEKPPDAPPDPVITEAPQQILISTDLEIVLGGGGALAGFGEVHASAGMEKIQDEAFDVADLERRPEPVSQAAPTYPPELKKAKIEGVVTLVFVLSEEGRVEDPRVENASRPEFERPALEAVRKWRFRPGEKDGKPVRTYIKQSMRFRIGSG